MKFLIALAALAVIACVNANPYGNIGYGNLGYGNLGYGNPGYGNIGGYGLGRVGYIQNAGYGRKSSLISSSSNPSAAAAAAAASSGVNHGLYNKGAVIGYELDGGYGGYGRGLGY